MNDNTAPRKDEPQSTLLWDAAGQFHIVHSGVDWKRMRAAVGEPEGEASRIDARPLERLLRALFGR